MTLLFVACVLQYAARLMPSHTKISSFYFLCPLILHPFIHDFSRGEVAGDVDCCTAHVEDAIYADDQGYAFGRDVDAGEDCGKDNEADAGGGGCADGGANGCGDQQYGFGGAELYAEDLAEEEGGDPLIHGGAVHIDCGADGDDEAADFWAHA